MHAKNNYFTSLLAVGSMIMLPASAAIIFSNDFEDGNLTAEVGTFTVANGTTSVVGTSGGTDATLGDEVALIDVTDPRANLDMTLGLTSSGSLTSGQTVGLSLDFATRRTNGFAKTVYIDARNAAGAVVARFVLGDSGAFGNAGSDRQRPGFQPGNTGPTGVRTLLPGPGTPGAYWWGADTNVTTFDVNKDAHVELVFGTSTFDVSTTSQGGTTYTTTGLSNFNSLVATEIASIRIHSAGTGAGFWIDNMVVEAIPEPSSTALFGLASLALLKRRRK